MKTLFIILLLLVVGMQVHAQFPPPSCDSVPKYQYLRHKYEEYLGKKMMTLYKEDSWIDSLYCYDLSIEKYCYFTIKHNGVTINCKIAKDPNMTISMLHSTFLYQTIEVIVIMVQDISIQTEDECCPVKCILYMRNEEK